MDAVLKGNPASILIDESKGFGGGTGFYKLKGSEVF